MRHVTSAQVSKIVNLLLRMLKERWEYELQIVSGKVHL